MKRRLLTTATLLALAACSNLALADDPPAQVGRIALTEGQVSISTPGEAADAALVNWPVTSNNTISTAPGARTELRIGSSTVRLDGDSALDVVQLDDRTLRLRLHYGSASVRVVNPDLAAGFELNTAHARVLLQQPGRVRVDAERVPDTSSVDVFEGVAIVEGGGERLTVRAGRSAEMQRGDLRTKQAFPDAFDDWVAARDRQIDGVLATRYVPQEMTGYEDLDRYGSWQRDSQYGNLWLPAVAVDWVPYRDGRWTWIAPWGWTWVDNAPWGYAPFHYGRWVRVNQRWAWAPGRLERYPVWAPALVGWVGGAGWSLTVNARPLAAQGWYPLSPHDPFVPGYRLPGEHLRRLNAYHNHHDGWRDGRHDSRLDYRQRGLTVVPHDRFGQRREILVPHEPRLTPPSTWIHAPRAVPPAPHDWRGREGWRADRRDGNDNDRRGREWRRDERDGRDGRWSGRDENRDNERSRTTMPAPVLVTQPPAPPVSTALVPSPVQSGFVQQPGTITTSPPSFGGRDGWRERREAFEERRRERQAPVREQESRLGAASAVIGTPRPAAPPSFVPQRGGVGGAMEAAAAAAAARAQAQSQAAVQMPPATAVAAPQRAVSSPAAAPALVTPAPRAERLPRQHDNPRQMER